MDEDARKELVKATQETMAEYDALHAKDKVFFAAMTEVYARDQDLDPDEVEAKGIVVLDIQQPFFFFIEDDEDMEVTVMALGSNQTESKVISYLVHRAIRTAHENVGLREDRAEA